MDGPGYKRDWIFHFWKLRESDNSLSTVSPKCQKYLIDGITAHGEQCNGRLLIKYWLELSEVTDKRHQLNYCFARLIFYHVLYWKCPFFTLFNFVFTSNNVLYFHNLHSMIPVLHAYIISWFSVLYVQWGMAAETPTMGSMLTTICGHNASSFESGSSEWSDEFQLFRKNFIAYNFLLEKESWSICDQLR